MSDSLGQAPFSGVGGAGPMRLGLLICDGWFFSDRSVASSIRVFWRQVLKLLIAASAPFLFVGAAFVDFTTIAAHHYQRRGEKGGGPGGGDQYLAGPPPGCPWHVSHL